MSDRDLLELAAKAAEIAVYWDEEKTQSMLRQVSGARWAEWDPLTDDGDALRLAVKLDMQIWRNTGGTVSAMSPCAGFWNRDCVDLEPDPYAATRRAIVRAAAEIGRSME